MSRDVVASYLYDLWSEADHAAKLCDEARRAFAAGRDAEALAALQGAKHPVGQLETRIADCVRVVAAA